MKCIHPDKPCPFRRWVCRDGECWWNCQWSCPQDVIPMDSECSVVKELGFCPFNCIYEALESDCPFRDELRKSLVFWG